MARENNGFGKDETDVMNDTAEIEDRDTPRIVTSAKLAGMIGTRPSNFIRFYEGERRPGIDYPWSIALTEENQDDTT